MVIIGESMFGSHAATTSNVDRHLSNNALANSEVIVADVQLMQFCVQNLRRALACLRIEPV